jgi:hypothetical protein
MVRVLVNPSYGRPEAKRHWRDTIDQEVPFLEDPCRRELTDMQFGRLIDLHPDGRAHFWGARARHDAKMAAVRTGDLALFAGAKLIRGVARVGAIFQNVTFADVLWPPKPGGDSWHTVYSLLDFTPTAIPYQELSTILGYKSSFDYPGQLVLKGDKAEAVLRDFAAAANVYKGPESVPGRGPYSAGQGFTRGAEADRERMHVSRTSYERSAGTVEVSRLEAQLQGEFSLTLNGLIPGSFRCQAGRCDLYISGVEGVEIIEAKSGTAHGFVRQALAQLLDYAPYSPRPADRLAALFPEPLARPELEFLHRYGIDCIHRVAPRAFRRLPAPDSVRARMRELWLADTPSGS